MEKCLNNGLSLAELAGLHDIRIAAGACEPLVKSLSVAEETHGDGGLGYAKLPSPVLKPTTYFAHDLIIKEVKENPGQITLLCVGPMTNLALALLKAPEIAPLIKRIVAMGGAIHYPGNATPQSEYNVFCDPEAFQIVIAAGVDLTIVPLDVTYQCIFTTEHLYRIDKARGEIKSFIADSTRFYMEFHASYQSIMGCAINDPLAAAILIRPDLVTLRDYFVEVELRSETSKAKTIADHYGAMGKAPNAHVAMEVDVAGFMEFFIERINRLS